MCALLGKKPKTTTNKTKGQKQTKQKPNKSKQQRTFASQAVITAILENCKNISKFSEILWGKTRR